MSKGYMRGRRTVERYQSAEVLEGTDGVILRFDGGELEIRLTKAAARELRELLPNG